MSFYTPNKFLSSIKSFPAICLLLLSTFIVPATNSWAQVICVRLSVNDSLALLPKYSTSVCGGDSISIGMATLPGYFHVINGPNGLSKSGEGGEGNGGALSFESTATPNNAGQYYASVTKEGCPTLHSNTVLITYQGPRDFNLTGGGFYCPGSAGRVLQLSGSETTATYRLYRRAINPGDTDVAIGSNITGTGSAISFPVLNITGNYYVRATNSRCSLSFGNDSIYNKVSGLKITALTPNSVNFSWSKLAGALDYKYIVTTSATPPASGTIITTGTAGLITSLSSSTKYYIYAGAQCSAGMYGDWSVLPFTTGAGCTLPKTLNLCTTDTAYLPAGKGEWNFTGTFPNNSVGFSTPGKEALYSFTPANTGFYYLQIVSASSGENINYLFKDAATGCNNNGWTGIGRFGTAGAADMGILQAGMKYYIIADKESVSNEATQAFKICQATAPNCATGIPVPACTPVIANIPAGFGAWDLGAVNKGSYTPGKELIYSYQAPTTGNYYIEVMSGSRVASYSFKESTSGCNTSGWTTLGPVYTNGAVNLGGLLAGKTYYILLDNFTDSANTQTFRICKADPPICTVLASINACIPFTATVPAGYGGWDQEGETSLQNAISTPGKELIYDFVPGVSGLYYIEMTSSNSGGVTYFYKQASGDCSNLGWKEIGTFNYDTGSAKQKSLGVLQAGTRYFILLDNQSVNASTTQVFKICLAGPPDCSTSPLINLCAAVTAKVRSGYGAWDLAGKFSTTPEFHTAGKESVFRFTPAATGIYYINLTNSFSTSDFLIKPASAGCDSLGWRAIGRYNNADTGNRIIGQLQAGIEYYILLDNEDPSFDGAVIFRICKTTDLTDCTTAGSLTFCSPVTTTVPGGKGNWDFAGTFPDNSAGNATPGKEIKYRFTPNVTGYYALDVLSQSGGQVDYFYKPDSTGCNNVGWTGLGSMNTSGYMRTGQLQAGVSYYLLMDSQDTLNDVALTFTLCKIEPPDCTLATPIAACEPVSLIILAGFGGWDFTGAYPNNSAGSASPGKEQVFSFIPDVSGDYYLAATEGSDYVNYLYKPASLSCGETGWIGIGSVRFGETKKIGSLQAGIQYYIIADNEISISAIAQTFQVCKADPPDCASPSQITLCQPILIDLPAGVGSWDFTGLPSNDPGSALKSGKELLYVFTPADAGSYYIQGTSNSSSPINFYFKPVAAGCSDTGWTVIKNLNFLQTDTLGRLNASVPYYIVADNGSTLEPGTAAIQICKVDPPNCSAPIVMDLCTPMTAEIPSGYGAWNLSPGKELIYSFTPLTTGYFYLELLSYAGDEVNYFYKPASTGCADSGWTKIGLAYSLLSHSGKNIGLLTAGITYYILLDKQGSDNASTQIFRICEAAAPPDCTIDKPVSLCTPLTATLQAGYGAWNFERYNSGGHFTAGQEVMYNFTPPSTGDYYLEVLSSSAANGNYINYLYKGMSGNCNDSNWTNLGNFSEINTGQQIMYQLQGGVKYNILLDNESTVTEITQTFQICKINPPDCEQANPVPECVSVQASVPSGYGAWTFITDSTRFDNFIDYDSTPGKETIYSFTPTATGSYYLELLSATTGDNTRPLDYFFKKTGADCSDADWKLVIRADQYTASGQYILGQLEAGVKYSLLLDNENINGQNQVFQICRVNPPDCADAAPLAVCSPITINTAQGAGAWDFAGNYPYNSVNHATPGKEIIYRFTPVDSGFYYLQLTAALGNSYIDYLYKPASDSCSNLGWTGIGRSDYISAKSIGSLKGGVPYYLLVDQENQFLTSQQTFEICKADPPDSLINQTLLLCMPDTATIASGYGAWDFSNSQPNNSAGYPTPGKELVYHFTPPATGAYFLEVISSDESQFVDYLYKEASAGFNGTGWTRIGEFNGAGGKNISQLNGGTDYLIMLDSENPFYTNKQVFQICKADPPDCDTAKALTLCAPYEANIPSGVGGWDFEGVYPNNSAGYSTKGKEAIYKFTPQVTGMYYLEITAVAGDTVDYLFKPVSQGCGSSGWTGIGHFGNPGGKNLGPLQAGVAYYIIADKERSNTPATVQTFKICKATEPDCSSATAISFSVPDTSIISSGVGGWDFQGAFPSNSTGRSTPGNEKIYRFTPVTTNVYFLRLISGNPISFLFKPVSAGCGPGGWTGIGSFKLNEEKTIGLLQAGVAYYIIADNEDINENEIQFVITGDRIICPGSATVFETGDLGENFSYSWEVDEGNGFVYIGDGSFYSGTGTTTLTIINAPTSLYGNRYRALSHYFPPNFGTAYTLTGDAKTLRFSNTWKGTQSGNWDTPANWSCGVLPDEGTDVVIPSGTPFAPIVNGNFSCRSIYVKAGTILTVANGFNLTITGKQE